MEEAKASNSEPSYFRNPISYLGIAFSIIIASALLVLIVLDLFFGPLNLYVQGFCYLILPGFLIVSLLAIPAGAFLEWKKKCRDASSRLPHINFNNPAHVKRIFTALAVITVFIFFSLYGSYRAYEYTESVQFCGLMCHKVMKPEYTAYHNSPHARVACVQCHIGSGAEWYVKSKFSGMYQIYSAMFNKYSRPIPTPIHNLRPAQQTCEQCHWPQFFFGAVEQDHQYYLPDEANSPWNTRMLMFVGGGSPPSGKGQGIHWHMNIQNKIYYVATDEKRQVIPWVKAIGPDGKETVYVAEGTEFTADKPPAGEMRRMDCIDCHNRPSHIYHAPSPAVNTAMSIGNIDPSLPYIKKEAVEALTDKYASEQEAVEKIPARIKKFYEEKYPEVWKTKQAVVEKAADTVTDIYRKNFFPQMKVSWQEYPNNIGHMIFPGCFRCHDGKHKEISSGKTITNSCNTCHSIIQQGVPGTPESDVKGLEFKHPEDIGDAWKDTPCFDCHKGDLA